MSDEKHECMELKHEPWPGFRPAFYILFGLFSIYLLVILLTSPAGSVGHH
jgi:hypothetical protein